MLYEKIGEVGVITLNRPDKSNSLRSGIQWGSAPPLNSETKSFCQIHLPLIEAGDSFGG